MKLYFHAGLRELAMAAGYQGSNLTALENLSNFKNTHLFLLDVFEGLYLNALHAFHASREQPSEPLVQFGEFDTFLTPLCAHQTPAMWVNFLRDVGEYVKFWLSLRCSNVITNVFPLWQSVTCIACQSVRDWSTPQLSGVAFRKWQLVAWRAYNGSSPYIWHYSL